jgi:aminoglycoside/choline kinase family phosphotransferase
MPSPDPKADTGRLQASAPTGKELERLRRAVSAAMSSAGKAAAWREPDLLSLYPLPGDASDRRYYRALTPSAPRRDEQSIVVMRLAEPCRDASLPFIEILRHLEQIGTPVPRLVAYEPRAGIVLLEDLGDVTLQSFLADADQEVTRTLYTQAIDILLQMQIAGRRCTGPEPPAFRLHFDVEKFVWELEFFVEHMICGLLGRQVPPRELEAFRREFTALSTILAREPRVFTHRDYHSRNIMVHQGELRVLDFQDARMGLCQYDLASLLRDSYVTLEEGLVRGLLAYYMTCKEAQEGSHIDPEAFCRMFDLTAVQRNLKAVGTFSHQMVARGNPAYLEYIAPTLRYVRQNVSNYPELDALGALLSKYLIPPYPFE